MKKLLIALLAFAAVPVQAVNLRWAAPTQWRFNLRTNVKFHDGTPFTADDVVFSFGRIQQPQGTMQVYVSGIKEAVEEGRIDLVLHGA